MTSDKPLQQMITALADRCVGLESQLAAATARYLKTGLPPDGSKWEYVRDNASPPPAEGVGYYCGECNQKMRVESPVKCFCDNKDCTIDSTTNPTLSYSPPAEGEAKIGRHHCPQCGGNVSYRVPGLYWWCESCAAKWSKDTRAAEIDTLTARVAELNRIREIEWVKKCVDVGDGSLYDAVLAAIVDAMGDEATPAEGELASERVEVRKQGTIIAGLREQLENRTAEFVASEETIVQINKIESTAERERDEVKKNNVNDGLKFGRQLMEAERERDLSNKLCDKAQRERDEAIEVARKAREGRKQDLRIASVRLDDKDKIITDARADTAIVNWLNTLYHIHSPESCNSSQWLFSTRRREVDGPNFREAATAAMGSREGEKNRPTPEKDKCELCSKENPVWFVDSELWHKHSGGHSKLCPTCFIGLAAAVGLCPKFGWELVNPARNMAAPTTINELADLRKELATKDDEIEVLKEEAGALNSQAIDADRECNKVKAQLAGVVQKRDQWEREFQMYRTAWIRELGGTIIAKYHEIDGLVLTTREIKDKLATAEGERAELDSEINESSFGLLARLERSEDKNTDLRGRLWTIHEEAESSKNWGTIIEQSDIDESNAGVGETTPLSKALCDIANLKTMLQAEEAGTEGYAQRNKRLIKQLAAAECERDKAKEINNEWIEALSPHVEAGKTWRSGITKLVAQLTDAERERNVAHAEAKRSKLESADLHRRLGKAASKCKTVEELFEALTLDFNDSRADTVIVDLLESKDCPFVHLVNDDDAISWIGWGVVKDKTTAEYDTLREAATAAMPSGEGKQVRTYGDTGKSIIGSIERAIKESAPTPDAGEKVEPTVDKRIEAVGLSLNTKMISGFGTTARRWSFGKGPSPKWYSSVLDALESIDPIRSNEAEAETGADDD